MSTGTTIEWTDATWNPITGCSRVSEGCRNCYAERFAHRFSGEGQRYEGLTHIANGHPAWTGKIQFNESALLAPLKWKRPRRVFVNSMSDLFHENVTDEMRDKIFAVMALCPQHIFQVLTKRPERMRDYLCGMNTSPDAVGRAVKACQFAHEAMRAFPTAAQFDAMEAIPRGLPNVWLGVSVENQKAADERIPLLLQTPAVVRFISAEPLLGPVRLDRIADIPGERRDSLTGEWRSQGESTVYERGAPHLDWVICGGESGPGARPMHPDWARSLRDQCRAAGVPFFFKQWGEWIDIEQAPWYENHPVSLPILGWNGAAFVDEGGHSLAVLRARKKAAGALLDGREWKQYPEAR